jgi:tetratricopeptide (TPR) repeat protein
VTGSGAAALLLALAAGALAQEPSPVPKASPTPSPSAAPSPSASPDPIAAAVAHARRLVEENRPADAVKALSAAGADPRVRAMTGVAYYHANDPLRAIEQLQAVLDVLPPDSPERREAIQVLGLSHYLAGHLAQSIPLLEQTRAFAPDSSELAYVLGMAYIQTRQGDRARETWARAFHVRRLGDRILENFVQFLKVY